MRRRTKKLPSTRQGWVVEGAVEKRWTEIGRWSEADVIAGKRGRRRAEGVVGHGAEGAELAVVGDRPEAPIVVHGNQDLGLVVRIEAASVVKGLLGCLVEARNQD